MQVLRQLEPWEAKTLLLTNTHNHPNNDVNKEGYQDKDCDRLEVSDFSLNRFLRVLPSLQDKFLRFPHILPQTNKTADEVRITVLAMIIAISEVGLSKLVAWPFDGLSRGI